MTRLRLVPAAAAAIVILVALGACSSQAARPARHVPFGWMGMLVTPPIGSEHFSPTDGELRTMAATGVESIRYPFYWRELQQDQGKPPDFSFTDRIVEAAARAQLTIMPTVSGTPVWARQDRSDSGSPPRDPSDYAAFLGALVDRYGPNGSFWAEHPSLPKQAIRSWQLWNEPDHEYFWRVQPYYAGYVALLRATYPAIKAHDPGAKVVLAGLVGRSWTQMEQLYRHGARRWFDVAAVHPFTLKLRNVLKIMQLYRAAMRRHGDARKTVVVSELTWPSSKGHQRVPSDFDVTERQQASLLSRAFRAMAANRVRWHVLRVYWAEWLTRDRSRTDPFDFTGLSRLVGSRGIRRKPAFFAYRNFARRVEGCAKAAIATRCR